MDDLLSLKWNNHQSTFINAFGILRNKQLYTDITLACEGKCYSVHKIVLSTCSDYFSSILSQTYCKNPVIILKDIRSDDLEYLLDYMYLGEVNVPQHNLTTLLKAAECLQLKGLAVPDDDQFEGMVSYGPNNRKRRESNTCSAPSSDNEIPPSKKSKDNKQILNQEEDIRNEEPNSTPPLPSLQTEKFPDDDGVEGDSPLPDKNECSTKSIDDDIRACSSGGGSINVMEERIKEECDTASLDHRDSGSYDVHNDDMFKYESNMNYDINSDQGEQDKDNFQDEHNHKSLPALLQHTSDALQAANFRPSFSNLSAFSHNEASGWNSDSSPLSLPLDFSSLEGSSHHNSTGVRLRQLLSISSALPNFNNSTKINGPIGTVSCTVCHKLFTGPNRRQVLRRHLIIHTGERPYSCHLCQYRANQKSNLNVHIITYHGKEHLKGRCS